MRAVRIAVAAAAVTALSGVALFSTADAGIMPEIAAPLTINKVVDGPVPPGTTFSVLVACDGDIIDDGMGVPEAGGLSAQGKGPGGISSAVLTFDETGAPTSAPNPIGFVGPGSCSVTETAAGGAATVAYACDGQIPVEEEPVAKDGPSAQGGGMFTNPCGSTAGGVTVSIEAPDQFAVVTVTNTFVAGAVVAQPVVLTPGFTG